jgi:hypothetical protein
MRDSPLGFFVSVGRSMTRTAESVGAAETRVKDQRWNKRTALMTTLIFLGLNGRSLEAGDDELTGLVLGVAAGKASKAQTGVFIERYSRPRRG